ncbi:hypothetical protein AB0G15_06065 [Streptosporangium sp. NPDC023825]|uniref:hypothetical protein n=1 Tax=Streptosporangium sp. NPDC023825 TaxID=3154909 RepID=UPI00341686E3
MRNVAEHVTISREIENKAAEMRHTPWSAPEVKAFIEAIKGNRMFAVMLLALIADRPAKVCGLRWDDVDLDGAGTIAIGNTRTIAYDRSLERGERNKAVEKGAKSDAGERTLPAPAPVSRALRAFRALQAQEKLKAGEGYESSGYVLVDELGRPWKTDKLRREAYKLMAAGVRKVRLYDARHACLS